MADYLKQAEPWASESSDAVKQTVSEMLSRIQREGLDAVRDYSRRLDDWDPPSFVVACLARVRAEIGDLERVGRVVKMLAFVNCAPGFSSTSAVVDGASELLEHVLGERGVHARAAIGTSVLPGDIGDIPVEVELVVEVDAG